MYLTPSYWKGDDGMVIIRCRFGDGMLAVARFSTPRGCVCHPEDRDQDLCAQHVVKWGVIGEAVVSKIYLPDIAKDLGLAEGQVR